jgi:hypothetical protein
MKNISFLLGSGFSVPAGYPTTTKLNERLCKIDTSEICIENDGSARFMYDGEVDPNADWTNVTEKKFVQEFLTFYSDQVLAPNGLDFHYETFYDYYSDALDSRNYELLASFPDGFRRKHSVDEDNDYLLLHFHCTFSQLIAWELRDRHEHGYLLKPYPPPYRRFLDLAEILGKTHRVHFHSLNHDLYMEGLAQSESLRGEMDDGFEDLGSPYFKRMPNKNGEYKERLSRFIDSFEKPFCLYKLHGSIDQFWIMHNGRHDWIKLRKGMNRWGILKEVKEHGFLRYVGQSADVVPDFLTGTKSKIKRYEGGYYQEMLNHFRNNLQSSNTLIIIGYGFGDEKINEFIELDFLTDDSKTLFVVGNKRRPPAAEALLARKYSLYLDGGVSAMDTDLILDKMNP